jgi:hypothetical protein
MCLCLHFEIGYFTFKIVAMILNHWKRIQLALDQVLENLVMFDHFWDFDRLVEDGAPRRSGDRRISPPFAGFLGLGFM